jgi:hypothetical protein
MKISMHWLGVLGVLLFSGTASADLVTNGGFETGNLTGWTTTGDPADIFVCGSGGSVGCLSLVRFQLSGAPHSGGDALAFGPASPGSIQQTLTAVAGQSYDISFWVETCPDFGPCNPNDLTASFGGTTLMSQSDIAPSSWQQFVFDDVTATSNSTVFEFSGENPQSYFLIDDVSVTPSVASVPEPSSIMLMAGTLIWVVASLSRRRLLTS